MSVATLVTLGLAPVLIATGAAIFLGERAGGATLLAMGLALAGLAFLAGSPGPLAAAGGAEGEVVAGVEVRGQGGGAGVDGGGAPAGALLAVGSAAGHAAVTLASRSLAGRVGAADLTAASFAVGAVVLLPVALAPGLALPASAADVALLAYLGAVPTALAYALFFAGLRTIGPTVASILTLLEPLTATTLGMLLLGERLAPGSALGAGPLLGAVLLLYRVRPTRSRAATAAAPP